MHVLTPADLTGTEEFECILNKSLIRMVYKICMADIAQPVVTEVTALYALELLACAVRTAHIPYTVQGVLALALVALADYSV